MSLSDCSDAREGGEAAQQAGFQRVFVPAEDASMSGDFIPLCYDDQSIRINVQTNGSIGKGRRHTITVVLKRNQADR